MEGTIYSIIPALITLLLVLLTRKVLLSLGTGIVIGALFVNDFQVGASIKEIWTVFYTIFYEDGTVNIDNFYLLTFLILLGIMSAFLQAIGGSRAFGEWMIKRVKTRVGAQVMTAFIGVVIFIDDYFNSLAVGQIARPLTDRQKISRAKLAYYIDSTSAPVTVLSPISSWGAYIIGILGSLFATYQITDMKPIEAFLKIIPYNFYAILALLLVFIVAIFKFDIGPMRKHEDLAVKTGNLLGGSNKKVTGDLTNSLDAHPNGKISFLFIPIIVLIVVTISMMLFTGAKNAQSEGISGIFNTIANMDVNISLFVGGILAVLSVIFYYIRLNKPKESFAHIVIEGTKTMLPAIYILILAWMIGSIIGTLKTGEYLAHLVTEWNVEYAFIPFILFIICGVMSLATGTSWGTFGIMLPIAIEIALVTDYSLLIPSLAAVLSGSVFGDHCTPISDTTILSSTGAGANHIDHVMTQLPYAFLAAIASGIGFLIVGFTHQLLLGLFISIVILAVVPFIYSLLQKKKLA